MSNPKVSIAVPYHQTPNTAFFLSRLLTSIHQQTFKDYEIILTNDGLMAENTNSAMRKATGELIKILYMDDYFYSPDSLEEIVKAFTKDTIWLATGCIHQLGQEAPVRPHLPEYTDDIETGNNKIGSPSVITLRNEGKLFFDEKLSYLLDCDLYKRYNATYGKPTLINDLNVVIGLHENQVSNTMTKREKLEEYNYMDKKYE